MIYEKAAEKSGKVIAVWGPVHRDCAISTTSALLASYIYCHELDKSFDERNMLVFSNELSRNQEVSSYLLNEAIPDGLTGIYNMLSTGAFKNINDITPFTYNLDRGFDVLGPTSSSDRVLNQLSYFIQPLLESTRKLYDYTIVDVSAGIRNAVSAEILLNSDLVLICVPQDMAVIQGLRRMLTRGDTEAFNTVPYMFIGAKYFEDFNHFNSKAMSKLLGAPILTVGVSSWIHMIMHRREMLLYFKKEHARYASGKADDCISEMDNIYEEIQLAFEEIEEEKAEKARLEAEAKANKRKARLSYVKPGQLAPLDENAEALLAATEDGGTTDDSKTEVINESFSGDSANMTEVTTNESAEVDDKSSVKKLFGDMFKGGSKSKTSKTPTSETPIEDTNTSPLVEEFPTEEPFEKETITEEAFNEGALTEESFDEEPLTEDTFEEEAHGENPLGKEAIPEEAIPEEVIPEEAIPEEAFDEEAPTNGVISYGAVQATVGAEQELEEDCWEEESWGSDDTEVQFEGAGAQGNQDFLFEEELIADESPADYGELEEESL